MHMHARPAASARRLASMAKTVAGCMVVFQQAPGVQQVATALPQHNADATQPDGNRES